MRQSVHFFLSAHTQFENLGDLLINRELYAILRQRGALSICVAGVPERFRRGLSLRDGEAVSSTLRHVVSMLLVGLLSRVSGSAPQVFLVLKPGGLGGECSLFGSFGEAARLLLFACARICGIKILRLGVSIGPYGPRRLFFERLKHRLIAYCGVRDSLSASYCMDSGIGVVDRFPDLAFSIALPRMVRMSNEQRHVIVSFRLDSTYKEGCFHEEIAAVLDAFDPERNFAVRPVVQVEFDLDGMSEMAISLRAAGRQVMPVCRIEDIASAVSIYSAAEIVFTNRLHVLLLALRSGTPAHAVIDPEKNRKILGLLRDEGLADLVLETYAPVFVPKSDETMMRFRQQFEVLRKESQEILDYVLFGERPGGQAQV